MVETAIHWKKANKSLWAPDNKWTTLVFCLSAPLSKSYNKTHTQPPKVVPLVPDRQGGQLQTRPAQTPSVEIQIKHTQWPNSSPSHPETHIHAHTNTLRTPSVTLWLLSRQHQKQPNAAPFVTLAGPLQQKDLSRFAPGWNRRIQGLITLSWLLLHVYYLLYASNFTVFE